MAFHLPAHKQVDPAAFPAQSIRRIRKAAFAYVLKNAKAPLWASQIDHFGVHI